MREYINLFEQLEKHGGGFAHGALEVLAREIDQIAEKPIDYLTDEIVNDLKSLVAHAEDMLHTDYTDNANTQRNPQLQNGMKNVKHQYNKPISGIKKRLNDIAKFGLESIKVAYKYTPIGRYFKTLNKLKKLNEGISTMREYSPEKKKKLEEQRKKLDVVVKSLSEKIAKRNKEFSENKK